MNKQVTNGSMATCSLAMLSGLAALAGMTACSTYDGGYDDIQDRMTYDQTFVRDFGQPAQGHQWGFDAARLAMSTAATRAIWKQDMTVEGVEVLSVYSKPANITEREHAEVYAWFTNHRVAWAVTPTHYEGTPTRATLDAYARVIDPAYPDYGSLTTEAYGNTLGDYEINAQLGFHNGWVQHVNSNTNEETVYHVPTGASDAANYFVADGEGNLTRELKAGMDTTSQIDKSSKMNYLYSWGLTADGGGKWQDHLLDFNKGEGYGYGEQSGQNAILVTDAQIDTWSYDSSEGNSYKHDKYIIVYLKGEDYEGWYLGFDFESDGRETSERIQADGICNDWIIKITDAGQTSAYNPARIMCEDLGGTFDMDFNDIVYDVEYTGHVCTITMQAAGGTLPINLRYGPHLLSKDSKSEIHELFGVDKTTPVNVGAERGKDGLEPIVWTIAFDGAQSDRTYDLTMHSGETFDMSLINVYVRSDDEADWVSITNLDGAAPYKICVPATTRWCREWQNIKLAYPKFVDWVQNPTILFWDGSAYTINAGYLH